MIKFTYKGKIYAPSDFEKKLKKLGITKEDVQIIEDTTPKFEQKMEYKYEYRLNQNAVLCAHNLEDFNRLKMWYGI